MSDVAKNNRFIFNIIGYRNLSMKIQTTSIGGLNAGMAPFPGRSVDLLLPSNKIDFSPMSVRVIVSEDWREWMEMVKWMYEIPGYNDAHLQQVNDAILTLLNANNVPIVEIQYKACYPISMTEMDMTLIDEETTVTFDLTLSYDSYTVTNLITGEKIVYGE